jgi:hypothetical protein
VISAASSAAISCAKTAGAESVKAKIRMYFLILIIFLVKLLSKLPINV